MAELCVKVASVWGPNHNNDGGISFTWSQGTDLGCFAFVVRDGHVECESESIAPDFLKHLLNEFVDSIHMKY